MKQVWVRGTSGLPFLRIPIFEQKSVGRKDSRITLLIKFLVTQKITNVCFYFMTLSVSQAKLANFRKTQTFSRTCLFSKIYRAHQKLPFYRIPIFGQKSVGQLLSRKLQQSHFIEFPFYQIQTVIK